MPGIIRAISVDFFTATLDFDAAGQGRVERREYFRCSSGVEFFAEWLLDENDERKKDCGYREVSPCRF
jgi:hypothetical protein